jgi:hypothetical protein
LSPTLNATYGPAATRSIIPEEQVMNIKTIKRLHALGNFTDVPVTLETDSGPVASTMKGQVLFVGTRQDTGIRLRISAFNATIAAVACEAGESGVISLGFVRRSDRLSLARNGELSGSLKMNLHYPLIDRLHGFRTSRQQEKDNFTPFVAPVKATFEGKFARGIGAVVREYTSIDKPPTTDLALSAVLLADEYYIRKIEFTLNTKILFPLALARQLTIQPVFVRSGPADAAPTGWSFDTLMENARVMWRKCCIDLDVLPPIYVDGAAFKSISTQQQVNSLRSQVADDPDAIEIFVTSSLGSLESQWGGGATFGSGTAAAQIVTCDDQLEVYQGTTSRGAVNYNHYAHELGHALSLVHPGDPVTAPMADATPNTVMEPSGFYADNPHSQSHLNCDNAANPVLRWTLVTWSRRCIHNPEI